MVAYFIAGHTCGVGCQEWFAERSKNYKHCFLPPLLKIRKILWHDLYSDAVNIGDLLEQASQHQYQTPHLPPSPPSQCHSWTATSSAYLDTVFLTTFRGLPHLPFAHWLQIQQWCHGAQAKDTDMAPPVGALRCFAVPYSSHWFRPLVKHEWFGNVGKLTGVFQSSLLVFPSLTLMQHITFKEDLDILFDVEVLQAKIQVRWMSIEFGIFIQEERSHPLGSTLEKRSGGSQWAKTLKSLLPSSSAIFLWRKATRALFWMSHPWQLWSLL